jgi:hypothetical protein
MSTVRDEHGEHDGRACEVCDTLPLLDGCEISYQTPGQQNEETCEQRPVSDKMMSPTVL